MNKKRFGVAIFVIALFCCVSAGSAQAAEPLGFESLSTSFTRFPAVGASPVVETQAGSHPDFNLSFRFTQNSKGLASEHPYRVVVRLPPGLVGDLSAIPPCAQAAFNVKGCGTASQVGAVSLRVNAGETPDAIGSSPIPPSTLPIFVLQRLNPSEPARIGFFIGLASVPIDIPVRSRTESDFGLDATVSAIPREVALVGVDLSLWGVPGSPVHDSERYDQAAYSGGTDESFLRPNPGLPLTPFLTLPTRCDAPLVTTLEVESYENPGVFSSASSVTPMPSGCGLLPFSPTAALTPQDSTAIDSPAGYDVSVTVPQGRTDRPYTSYLRRAEVTLPEGVSINPPVAEGLVACGDQDLKLGSAEAATCPSASKIGSAEIDVPILGEGTTLDGGLYVRPQTAAEPYRVAIVVSGLGVNAKIPGVVRADPTTGRLTATFAETPQIPFTEVRVKLDQGPRAVLANPQSCGKASTNALLTPWSGGATVAAGSAFDVSYDGAGAACPQSLPFTPAVEAGSASNRAGQTAGFVLNLSRPDKTQYLSSLTVTPPKGLLAYVGDVPLCGDAAATAGTCPAASRIGSVTAAAGAGSSPLEVGGSAYLTGPYKGAPYGLAFSVPAIAGPFDLGDVVVRAAVKVDPVTTQLTVVSDPFPQILQGVPLRLREIRVNLDRPRFTVNPTSCEEASIQSTVYSTGGAQSNLKAPFSLTNCAALGFRPKLSVAFSGATKRGGNPALKATLRPKAGDANISRVQVLLPKSSFIDQAHINNPCTRVQFDAGKCPASSVLGIAKAQSPLLDRPLEGPVYFRSNGGERRLPDIVADLDGQIHVVLVGFIDSKKQKGSSRVRATFATVPDAPVSTFTLSLKGGKRGLIENSADLCKGKQVATVRAVAHSGKIYAFGSRVQALGCGGKKKKSKPTS